MSKFYIKHYKTFWNKGTVTTTKWEFSSTCPWTSHGQKRLADLWHWQQNPTPTFSEPTPKQTEQAKPVVKFLETQQSRTHDTNQSKLIIQVQKSDYCMITPHFFLGKERELKGGSFPSPTRWKFRHTDFPVHDHFTNIKKGERRQKITELDQQEDQNPISSNQEHAHESKLKQTT